MHWYDIWNSFDGNITYVQTNIDPKSMKNLENQFLSKYQRNEFEEDSEYPNRFFEFLRENEGVQLVIFNRPSDSIRLDLD